MQRFRIPTARATMARGISSRRPPAKSSSTSSTGAERTISTPAVIFAAPHVSFSARPMPFARSQMKMRMDKMLIMPNSIRFSF